MAAPPVGGAPVTGLSFRGRLFRLGESSKRRHYRAGRRQGRDISGAFGSVNGTPRSAGAQSIAPRAGRKRE